MQALRNMFELLKLERSSLSYPIYTDLFRVKLRYVTPNTSQSCDTVTSHNHPQQNDYIIMSSFCQLRRGKALYPIL